MRLKKTVYKNLVYENLVYENLVYKNIVYKNIVYKNLEEFRKYTRPSSVIAIRGSKKNEVLLDFFFFSFSKLTT